MCLFVPYFLAGSLSTRILLDQSMEWLDDTPASSLSNAVAIPSSNCVASPACHHAISTMVMDRERISGVQETPEPVLLRREQAKKTGSTMNANHNTLLSALSGNCVNLFVGD